jgi:hypothetical protein
MKVTFVMVAPVPATGVAVKVTVRFTLAPGEANVIDEGVLVPPVPVPAPVPGGLVEVVPDPPPQAVSMTAIIPTARPEVLATRIRANRLSYIGDFPCRVC